MSTQTTEPTAEQTAERTTDMDPSPTDSNADESSDPDAAGDAEREFRRRWYKAHHDRFAADQEGYREQEALTDGFAASADEALELLVELKRTGDLQLFVERMQAWAVKPTTLSFKGTIGQMQLNGIAKRAREPEQVGRQLAECLTVPASDDEAAKKIRDLCAVVESIRTSGHPTPRNVPFVVSYFWALADHGSWPVIWPSAVSFLERATGEDFPDDPAERYQAYLSRVREISNDNNEFETTAAWWDQSRPVFLDEVMADRAQFGLNYDEAPVEERERNARALVSIARAWGKTLAGDVSGALGRRLKFHLPRLDWIPDHPRGDLWVDWRTADAPGLGVRVWVNHRGAAVAIRPGVGEAGLLDTVTPIIEAADYAECRVLGGQKSRIGDDVGFFGSSGEFVYGRWFERSEFAEVDLRVTVVEVATQLRPLFEELHALILDGDPLARLVEEWLDESKYPTSEDEDHRGRREAFADLLAPDAAFDVSALSRIWNTGDYGGPGVMPALNRTVKGADESELGRIENVFQYLCWGDAPDEERIDRMLGDDEYRVSGLGESVIMKLLAITHPDTYIPVFPYEGKAGKRKSLRLLGLDEPEGTTGEKQVASNKLLRDRLEPFLPGDLWGMSRFLWWLLGRDGRDVLRELAEELLIERSFLGDIVALLEKKRQVVFFGPPGTGKTYLARKLAKAIAPEQERRAIVQFHPASSYEDFFEGYRPADNDRGELTYRLTPGPLARMAEKAAASPDETHVMIIDEINRANLPKVLGELLFLLEYRDESVQTLYRRDDGFSLPENLWFIGTMNTADRSIALVDAALRRRFQFVEFFPDKGPMAGLLDRWLAANDEPAWVGELVSQVNDELERDLSGSHLLLGPSYFMDRDLDEEQVKRIWQYNIEPLLEDQFFGDQNQIDRYRFKEVLKRFERSRTESRTDSRTDSGPDDDVESGYESASESTGDTRGGDRADDAAEADDGESEDA